MNHFPFINLMISLLLPTIVGYALVILLCRRISTEPFLVLALAYGLGMGILSQIMLLLGITNIPYTRWTIEFFLVLTLGGVLLPLAKKQKASFLQSAGKPPDHSSVWSAPADAFVPLNKKQKAFCLFGYLYIAYNILIIFLRSSNNLVESWDSIATITLKAKVFFFDHALRHLPLSHISYPLHVSFLQTWTALNLERWDETLINAPILLTCFSFLVLHYYFLRSRTNAAWAVGGVCLLLASNFFVYHASIPYADFSLMYYNCAAIALILVWAKENDPGLLVLASLFSGFMTFVKLEGTLYLGLHTLFFVFLLVEINRYTLKEKSANLLTFVIPSYGIAGVFHLYKMIAGITGMEERLGLTLRSDLLQRSQIIIKDLAQTFFFSGNWNMLWVVLLVGILTDWSRVKQDHEIRLLVALLGMFLIVYILFFLFTPIHIDYYNIYNALSRIILHFFPLVTWIIILLFYPQRVGNDS